MVHAQESAHVNEFNKTAEWLNQFQIMTKIGVTPEQVKVDPVAQALLKATLESLPVRDHEIQALAQQNMKQYEWSHETSKESVLSKESLGVIATGCAASDHQLWGCLQRLPNPDDEVHQGVGEVVFKAEDP